MQKPISVVTGANGFIGSHLIPYLLEQKHTVKCIVRESSDLKWVEHLDVEFIKCGLNDINVLHDVFKDVHHIFHLAGSTNAKHYDGFVYGNITLTENILKAAEGIDSIKSIILTSSLAASAPSPLDDPATELTPSAPVSNYGKSKLEMEQIVKEKYSHLPYVIVRPPVVYGPRDTEVLLFFKAVSKGLISIIGFNEKQVSLVYIDDLVQGLFLAATHPKSIHQTYFFESDRILKWKELGDEVAKVLSKKAITLKIPHFVIFILAGIAGLVNTFQKRAPTLNWQKAKEITKEAWTCSSEKAQRELGYKPKVSYKEGFKITLDWYREHQWL